MKDGFVVSFAKQHRLTVIELFDQTEKLKNLFKRRQLCWLYRCCYSLYDRYCSPMAQEAKKVAAEMVLGVETKPTVPVVLVTN